MGERVLNIKITVYKWFEDQNAGSPIKFDPREREFVGESNGWREYSTNVLYRHKNKERVMSFAVISEYRVSCFALTIGLTHNHPSRFKYEDLLQYLNIW